VKAVFADAGYWIAISNPHDSLHDRAREVSRSLPSKRVVTSEMVFTEFF
jgi:predicted nucleic acid-binding protein